MEYTEFLECKRITATTVGFEVSDGEVDAKLFDFQRAICRWACRLGRAAIFAGCGLGKTVMQLEWARLVCRETGGGRVLILAPLAVARQTAREAEKLWGDPVKLCRNGDDVTPDYPAIYVTNYERLHLFDTSIFSGVVLDESSILKAYMGKTKQELLTRFAKTPYRLACTATPAPNDHLELGNHAQFLSVMDSNEMISRWFINDTMHAGSYRLKRYAESDFWRWIASWAVCLERPSDLGFSDDGFVLPPLNVHQVVVPVDCVTGAGAGELFRSGTLSSVSMHREMRLTAQARATAVAELVNADTTEVWVVWCNTNYEADELARVMPDAVEIRGNYSDEQKEQALEAFGNGEVRALICKPSMFGHGLNWQHCARVAFVGLSYSFEQLYQAVRRTWRFGQKRPVECYLVVAETEGEVLRAVQRKQVEFDCMRSAMVAAVGATGLGVSGRRELNMDVNWLVAAGDAWTLHLGDCVEALRKIESDSVGLTIFSPPFSNLYIYSDSYRDMGNAADDDEFFRHFGYLLPELLRVTIPGRLCAVHCKDLPMYRGRDGAGGLRDFPGRLTAAMEAANWTYHSKVTIWKDPVTEMQRTKNQGLLYKQAKADTSYCRQGMADYLVVFRKWNEAAEFPAPVCRDTPERFTRYVGTSGPELARDERDYSIQVWQRYASPVWFDIDQTNVLNYELGKDGKDEKHICPLQLGVIERVVELWTNPGDLVLSPFAGIGSEGYVSVKLGRQFIGVELKESYWRRAAINLELAAKEARQKDLFDIVAV